MSTLYEIVELANGDIALQKEGDAKLNSNRAPLVTMRFSTDLVRFLRSAKMDIAKVMIEAGLERVANLAESVSREELESKIEPQTSIEIDGRTSNDSTDRMESKTTSEINNSLINKSTIDNSLPNKALTNHSLPNKRSPNYSSDAPVASASTAVPPLMNRRSTDKVQTNKRSMSNHRVSQSLRSNNDIGTDLEEQHPTVSHLLH